MNSIRVAIPTNDKKEIFSHLGRAKGFLIVEIADGKIVGEEYIENNITGHGRSCDTESHHSHSHSGECSPFSERHNEVAKNLANVSVVISRGMGPGIQARLECAGIKIIFTSETDIASAINKFIEGKLVSEENVHCAHHHKHSH